MKKTIILFGIIMAFSSCFKSYVQLDITNKWNHGKMKELTHSEKAVEVYFTNKVALLSDAQMSQDQVLGVVSSFEPLNLSRSNLREPEINYFSKKKTTLPEVQIFIAEEYRDQDTLVISQNNFIQMREYQIDRSATYISFIGSAAVLLILVLLILGIAAYYAYLTSNITSTL